MSTIPPYLYAMYSIKDQKSDAACLIASIAVEEMLHLALTTNLLLALGGEPDFGVDLIPTFPSLLAHHQPDLTLELRRCTPEVVRDMFMVIERPEDPGSPPEDDQYETLGQYYAALEIAIEELSADMDIFANHQPDRQLSDPSYYGPVAFDAADSGGLMLIDDAVSARQALEIVVHQGEGLCYERWADPAHQELTHFYKFAQLADGTTPIGETWPVVDNPRTAELPAELQPVSDLFNAVYTLVFRTMGELCTARRSKGALVGLLYGLMKDGMAPVACYLARRPLSETSNAGPTFEWYEFDGDPETETLALARDVARSHPELDRTAATMAKVLTQGRG